MFHTRIFLFLLSTIIFNVSVFAQRVKIFGTVRDTHGSPIELATVRVAGTAALTVSNLRGEYSLYSTSTDSVVVVCAMVGYETRKRTLLAPKDSVRIDFVLPDYSIMVSEAVVKTQGKQLGTTQRITLDASRQAPSTTGNAVEELVTSQAGVSSHSELSSQYNVRGGSFDENVVYLNGIELYRPQLVRSGQQEGLSIINSDMVESIRFSAGGFEAKYGDKMSSVLDITYKRPERLEASVNTSLLGAGLYAGWGDKKGKFSLMSSVRYKTTSYLLGSLDTNGEYNPNFLDYQLFASWRPSSQWSLDILGNFADNRYSFFPQDRDTRFGTLFDARSFKVYFDGKEDDSFQSLFTAATLTRHFSPSTYLAAQVSNFSTNERETYDIQGQYWLSEATTATQLGVGTYMEHARNFLNARIFKLGLRFGTRLHGHQLLAGIDWRTEYAAERAREWEMRDSSGYSLPHSAEALQLIYALHSENSLTAHTTEAYVQDTYRHNSAIGLFNLTYGLRFTHRNWNNESFFSPRLSLGFIPSSYDNWTFRLATGWYYQPPFYKELRQTSMHDGVAEVLLNTQARSQQSFQFVIGSDYAFRLMNRPFKLTTEAYYKHFSLLIPYTIDNVRIVYEGDKTTNGFAAGVDVKLFGEFVPGTDSWLTFSLMRTQERLNGSWIPRPTDQIYNFSLFFTDYFPGSTRWAVTLRGALAGGLPFTPPHTDRSLQTYRAPSYKRVDIGLAYHLFNVQLKDGKRPIVGTGRWLSNAWIGLDCFNLLGIRNVSSYYWITDISNSQHAVPNYLTGRQLNLRFSLQF